MAKEFYSHGRCVSEYILQDFLLNTFFEVRYLFLQSVIKLPMLRQCYMVSMIRVLKNVHIRSVLESGHDVETGVGIRHIADVPLLLGQPIPDPLMDRECCRGDYGTLGSRGQVRQELITLKNRW